MLSSQFIFIRRIMKNIWITLSYDGTIYGGFQRQENRMTVQEMVENCIMELTGKKTTLYFVARMPVSMPTGRSVRFIRIPPFPETGSFMP